MNYEEIEKQSLRLTDQLCNDILSNIDHFVIGGWATTAYCGNIRFTTDVIVGFPGETEKQFQNTVKLFKKIKFNIAYINKYSPRWGTAASKLKDDVPWPEKKRREKILMDLLNAK